MARQSSEIILAGMEISRESDITLYTQVYEQFRKMILTKRLRSGDRLPATRLLCKQLGVSRIIITQSFEQLILEGYLVARMGSGTFVANVLPDELTNVSVPKKSIPEPPFLEFDTTESFLTPEFADYLSNREEIIPFQRGTPSLDQFPYKVWYDVSTAVLKKLKTYHLGYEHTIGYLPLREQIATYLRVTRGVKCETEQIIVVTGSQQGLNLIVHGILKNGDAVWMEDPGYLGARVAFLNGGLKIYPVPVEQDGIDVEYIKNNCPNAKLGFVTPSHQYPLGVTMSLTKRLQLLDWAKNQKVWIFEDDYDSEFRYQGRPLASLQGLDTEGRVIYTGTFSKVLFPGLRLAYLVLPSVEMVNKLKNLKIILDRQSPILDQLILTQFMKDGHFLRHLRKMRLLYSERQLMLTKLIEEKLSQYLEVQPEQAGMNLTCWLSSKVNIEKLKLVISQEGIVVSFINDYSIQHLNRPGISLGYTAFSKYRLSAGIDKLLICFQQSTYSL